MILLFKYRDVDVETCNHPAYCAAAGALKADYPCLVKQYVLSYMKALMSPGGCIVCVSCFVRPELITAGEEERSELFVQRDHQTTSCPERQPVHIDPRKQQVSQVLSLTWVDLHLTPHLGNILGICQRMALQILQYSSTIQKPLVRPIQPPAGHMCSHLQAQCQRFKQRQWQWQGEGPLPEAGGRE